MENPYLEKHILTSIEIVRSYLFDKPFHLYLKEVFRNHKNWGSKDRRNYKKYCYILLKNAGTLGQYLQGDAADFAEKWELQWGDLPFYYWPICLFNPKTISKLNLVELNYSNLGKNSENVSNFNNNELRSFNSSIDPIKSADFGKITSTDNITVTSSINHSKQIDRKLQDLEWLNSYTSKVSLFNKAIVDWVFELEKGNYNWDAYTALEFSMNQILADSGNLLHNNSGNQKKLHQNSISKGVEVAQINKWFQNEAPVFYLDKNTGLNKEFAPNYPVNEWVDNGLGIIQDRSSTRSIEFLLEYIGKENILPNLKVWDCCSGAGGKSLSFQIQYQHHFKHVNPIIQYELFKSNWICTDVRQTIIDNLKKRYNLLDLTLPKAVQLNLLDDSIESLDSNILESNLIIADLPCSGSGTWRRTPEELLKTVSVMDFAERQLQIMENVLKIKSKRRSGSPCYIYYMTCSVFALENEKNIDLLLEKHPELECIWQNFFGGYLENADFIYGALIKVN